MGALEFGIESEASLETASGDAVGAVSLQKFFQKVDEVEKTVS